MQKIKSSILILLVWITLAWAPAIQINDSRIVSYTVDLKSAVIKLYWKNDKGNPLRSIGSLKTFLTGKKQKLLFAMNGGMYKTDNSPLGLFIQNGKQITPLNTSTGYGNFYMQPNGVLVIDKSKKVAVCKTSQFPPFKHVEFATQSGPMMVVDGQINSAFKKGSTNLNIRNGVGILPDGKALFAISNGPVNFYDFALYFQQHGCKNALYLDGFVSRMYLPEKNWEQTDGDFGVMIGVTVAE